VNLESIAVTRSTFGDFLKKFYRHRDRDKAISFFANVAEAFGRLKKDHYPDTAYWYECLSRGLYENGDYCQAALVLEKAIQLHRSHGRDVSDDVVRCLDFLGRYYLWTGRPVEAERTLGEALTLVEHLPIDEQDGRGFVLVDLAQMHCWDGEYEIADGQLHQAAKEMLRYCGYGDPHIAFVFLHLSFLYARQNRLAIAERAIKKAIRMYRIDGSTNEERYAALITWRGVVEERQNRLDEARISQTEALAILEPIRKPGHYFLEKVRCRLQRVSDQHSLSTSIAT
jgi:tetratricopeptide (TPR) repeat protein